MNKKIYISLIVTILTSSVFGQFVGKDPLSISLYYMQKTEIDSAKKYIDIASNSLSVFKDCEEKKILENLTSFSLARNF